MNPSIPERRVPPHRPDAAKAGDTGRSGAPLRIVFPVVLTVALFAGTLFFFFLPLVEDRMMAGKREMIRELAETAWSVLSAYERDAAEGHLSVAEAQSRALERLRDLRYGPEAKDYFWVNDMHPRLLMHPYRPDLEGTDISGFVDPGGKRLFVEVVRTVQRADAGYVDYLWQWKDDPDLVVPKISYVKGFEPWGWIVGTGVYVEDVRAETAAIRRKLVLVCAAILTAVVALSGYIVWQGILADRRRRRAQETARRQQEQLYQAGKLASIGTLASGIAHEINNPITAVLLNAQTLDKTWRALGPVLDETIADRVKFTVGGMPYELLRGRMPQMLEDIVDAARRVQTIVADLKDFARLQPTDLSEAVDVNRSVQRAAGLAGNLIQKSTREFSMDLAPDLPAVRGSAQRLEQVLVNLLVNACQALTGPDDALRVATAFDAEENRVRVTVTDGGGGIPPEAVQRIKDPFFTTKRDRGGTGLGLAVSDRIVRDHGGRLSFSAAEPRGTTAVITLPATSPSDEDRT